MSSLQIGSPCGYCGNYHNYSEAMCRDLHHGNGPLHCSGCKRKDDLLRRAVGTIGALRTHGDAIRRDQVDDLIAAIRAELGE